MDELIAIQGDAGILGTLNANSGYWLVKITEEYREKTAFLSHHGQILSGQMQRGLKPPQRRFVAL